MAMVGDSMLNRVLLLRTWRFAWLRVLIVGLVTFAWGWLLLFFYSQFSDAIRQLVSSNPIFEQFANFGSGNLFTVPGAITLGTQHPFLIALIGIFAVGSAALAIAGERQAGTLEVLLARPIPRRGYLLTQAVAILVIAGLLVALLLAGMVLGVQTQGVADQLDFGQLPLMCANGFLLWAAFTTFSLAMSASFDRSGPALSLSLAYLLLNYFLIILGSFWTDAQWIQSYSLFDHFQPQEILAGKADPYDFALLTLLTLVPLAYALWIFPRRDLAAPA
jgi:ABC-type transport system involved in multi-copper enzyme maturation permease subunit